MTRRSTTKTRAALSAALVVAGAVAYVQYLQATADGTDDHHPAGWVQVFGDEFDGTSLDRDGKWCTRYQYGGGMPLQPGFGDTDPPTCTQFGGGTKDFLNDEQQRYLDVSSDGQPLHVVQNGYLSLRATATGYDPKWARFEAGMIRSKQEFRPTASVSLYITARVRMPDVKGTWPAFWLTPGLNANGTQWPPELDIFEGALNRDGDNADMIHLAAHGTNGAGAITSTGPHFKDPYYRSPAGNLRNKWVEIGLRWTDHDACWYIDEGIPADGGGTRNEEMLCQKSAWKDDSGKLANPSPILLNLAVGGRWAGRNGFDDNLFPASFDIDHVRVYASSGTGVTTTTTRPTTAPSGGGGAGGGSGGGTTTTTTTSRPPMTRTTTTTSPAGRLVRGEGSGRCLTAHGIGAPVTIERCGSQRWVRTNAGELRSGGSCLDAVGQGRANRTLVQLWACNGGENQRWTRRADGTLAGAGSNRCLDVRGASTASGAIVQLYDCHARGNQRWTFS